jgi:type IX secretion system substrate protein
MKKIIILLTTIFCLNINAQIITTIAGNGTQGGTGDGGQATLAELSYANSVAVDAMGNVYISDENNQVIRKVNTAGVISTFVGTFGTGGYAGDGGQATAAELADPLGIAFDAMGNLYIADQGNQRIRMVNTAGIISTIAGNGTNGYSGDGGQATAAEFSNPSAIALDAMGNIYITDGQNMVIRMINTAGIISTFAGTYSMFGMGGYSGDGGPATAAQLNQPACLAVDVIGNVYIADAMNQRIRIVNTAGVINTFAGNGTNGYSGDGGQATAAELSFPYGVAFDAIGNLYITNDGTTAQVIQKVNTAGIISTFAGNGTEGYSGDGGLATAAEFNAPFGITFDATGNMYVADFLNNVIRFISAPAVVTVNAPALCIGNTSTLTANGATTYTWSPATTLSATTGSVVVANPTLTTTYSVNATNNFTVCNVPQTSFGMDTVRVTVNSLPVITAQSGNVRACGDIAASFTVNSPGNNAYQWYYFQLGDSVGTNTAINGSYTEINYTTDSMTIQHLITGSYNGWAVYCTVTNTNNCSVNSKQDSIIVNPLPTIMMDSADVCFGGSATLNVAGASTYTWSTGATTTSITATPTVTTSYTVSGTDVNGCVNKVIDTIQVFAVPNVTVTTSTVTLCVGHSATLTASGASTYSWNTSDTTANIIISPTVTTTYTVTGASIVGCENIAIITQSVSACGAGIEQYNSNNEITVYPNPNNGNFIIEPNNATIHTVQLIDINGKLVLSQIINGKTIIDASSLSDGVYNISIISNEGVVNKKLVIVR